MQLLDPVLDLIPLSISLVDHKGRAAWVGDDDARIILRLAPFPSGHFCLDHNASFVGPFPDRVLTLAKQALERLGETD